ncbi:MULTISPECIES: terminase small subunit [unclassified Streptococcus]|uniref:terminase small subunit n=1 Tax=unclassified Streptococcus TaxID=2608887 RepID=UPI0020C8527F|nr:terminase small subunit [Streptococcus sp. CF7_Ac1-12]MCP9084978.1 terminase small subunit [Streptococcus sp. CF7_Ac1-8]
MDKLTPKQELFVQGIISGLSQRQAYRQAFSTSKKWKDSTVDVKASELLQNGKVLVRYRELLKQFSNMSLWSREQAFNEYEWLKNKARASIENEGIRQANSNAFLSALDGMNNMAWKDLELTDEKIRQEIELLKIKIERNQDSKSDTTLMEALLNAVKGGDEVED